MDEQITRFRGYVRSEREAALLYRRLADTVEGDDRAVLLELARGEEAHAAHWEAVLAALGGGHPRRAGPPAAGCPAGPVDGTTVRADRCAAAA